MLYILPSPPPQNTPELADFNSGTAFGYRHSCLRNAPNYTNYPFSWFFMEEEIDDFLISLFFFFFLKRGDYGNNKAHNTFSPNAKITFKGLPFSYSLRT